MLSFFTAKKSKFLTTLASRKVRKTASNKYVLQTYAELHIAQLFRTN